jgi:hypothetical protein
VLVRGLGLDILLGDELEDFCRWVICGMGGCKIAFRCGPQATTMLLWINGPCGVGKTVTAFELNRRLPGSVVCDPEHVGFGMHRMLPPSLRAGLTIKPSTDGPMRAWLH